MPPVPHVRAGLGWPEISAPASRPRRPAGLGWPGDSDAHPAVSRESGAPTVTREHPTDRFGPAPAPGTRDYPTAAGMVAQGAELSGSGTPLAAETDRQVRAAHRIRLAAPLPQPPQPRVFAVANQKGGVGKTTTAVNLAAALAQQGARVLLIDLDPQGNASTALGVDHAEGVAGVYEALIDETPLAELVQPSADVPGLAVVPATIDLAGAEIELVSLPEREFRLRRAVIAHLAAGDGEDRLDYVFIDCPPSLGLLTVNALVAGQELLVPIQCEYYALEGVGQLLRNVERIRSHLNPQLSISTVVLTMYDGRTRLSAAVADEVRAHFGSRVLQTAIPRSVRISEAPSYSQSVMTYDPTSPGALCYLEAAREVALQRAPAALSTSAEAR